MTLLSGARFLAKCGGTAVYLAKLSEDDACRFANDDDVDEENDERRFCVDILFLDQTQFTVFSGKN